MGESGCGKSILARQLTLIETPTGGVLIRVRNLLLDLRNEMDVVYLFTFQGLGLVRHIADEVLAM
jgi:ABC-type oligopeptide transport system ATPase subunit